MINLKNMGPTAFKRYIKDKQIVIFGAGRALDSCLDIYFENENVLFVVDNNKKLWNTEHVFNNKEYTIFPVKELIKAYKENNKLICFINSPFYANEIVKQLDGINELSELECYLSIVMRKTIEEIKPWSFTNGPQLIPKKIHYIWVGGNELPDEFKENIESWRKYNPDYEIIRWDESKLNVEDCEYVKQAYKKKEWAFVSNYLRLKVIYENGGIYLDTDVEAVANFDVLLNDKAFFNMGCADRVNNGCGFGAVKSNKTIAKMLRRYSSITRDDLNNKSSKLQGHIILNSVLRESGFVIDNQYQKNKRNEVLYPNEVMSPFDDKKEKNKKTVSIHKESGTWKSEEEQIKIADLLKLM